ncbi:MAG: circularly permuted type 2 ATP-grasp protein [Hyphomicrobiales bacterium]|nr:circularly permuted type 2 ATP-grasp protein [Hyphomicrobiales bacterium]MBV9114929.1 circularly permuted type 2 ATP-grasp protein [Hyphomicrobiales bacterium]
MASRGRGAEKRLAGWIAGYAGLPGVRDEFIAADGKPRPQWLHFLQALADLDAGEIARRFASADRHIRDMGISYRVYGETGERAWPLSHLPLLIGEDDWRQIAAGVEQRAELLETLLGDLYGEARLVLDGILPAAAVTGSVNFLRPLQGVKPPGGRHLHLYAADLGRGPDGRWWVLGDRAQAPSGAGYALENRLVLSRAMPLLYNEMNVERLAAFFQAFRAGLRGAASRSEPRICLLTPGPLSETYFEQAYLARYLGFLLVEGDDLLMRDGHVHVRTIAGLKRADVIWRRVDGDFTDPLDLNAASRLGVPGLTQALRDGNVVVANMPGCGVIEAPAFMSFMPSLSRRLMGEQLKLPNIATWWCGQSPERDEVIERLDQMAIAGAFRDAVPGFPSTTTLLGNELGTTDRARLIAAMRERGADYVGQEVVKLSTTPFWENGHLSPRPFTLRVFAAATPKGWRVMPGGFCRISDEQDARAFSMGEGVRSADVWILGDKPAEMVTLLPQSEAVKVRRLMGILPSRAADNLFWLGRYVERAEATLRLIRCLCGRSIETDSISRGTRPTVERLQRLLIAWGAVPKSQKHRSATAFASTALHQGENYGSAAALSREALRTASVIRERLSPDAWRLIVALEGRLDIADTELPSEVEAFERADQALRALAALSGLMHENINRIAGWRFLDMGRRIERGIATCRFARLFAAPEATADDLDVVLDLIDSQITYRSRYRSGVALAPARDMVVLDPYNPRSVAFQVAQIDAHLADLPILRDDGILETPRRMSTSLHSELAVTEAEELDKSRVLAIEQRIMRLADAVAARYFLQGPSATRRDKQPELA